VPDLPDKHVVQGRHPPDQVELLEDQANRPAGAHQIAARQVRQWLAAEGTSAQSLAMVI
jgi:hypothetical protein